MPLLKIAVLILMVILPVALPDGFAAVARRQVAGLIILLVMIQTPVPVARLLALMNTKLAVVFAELGDVIIMALKTTVKPE